MVLSSRNGGLVAATEMNCGFLVVSGHLTWNRSELMFAVSIDSSGPLSVGRSPWCESPRSRGCRRRCEWKRWVCSPRCSQWGRSSQRRAPPSGPGPAGTAEDHPSHPEGGMWALNVGNLQRILLCVCKAQPSPGTQQVDPLCLWTQHRSWSLGHGRPRTSSAGRSWSRWWAGELGSGILPEIRSPSHLKHWRATLKSPKFPDTFFSTPFPVLTPGVPPPRDPAVVSRVEAGLLARQAGVADEVWGVDVRCSLHQGDVIVQLAVSGVSEVLVPVDSLHRENPLCCLGPLQLVLPQDDPPAPRILSFTPEMPKIVHNWTKVFCFFSSTYSSVNGRVSYFWKQWAAVRTQFLWMSVPPQTWMKCLLPLGRT